jgi:hypothetical protein
MVQRRFRGFRHGSRFKGSNAPKAVRVLNLEPPLNLLHRLDQTGSQIDCGAGYNLSRGKGGPDGDTIVEG